MAVPIGSTVVCPKLIGRTFHVEALLDRIDRLRNGKGQIVTIGGDAGVGKSRLVSETKAIAGARGLRILQGNCFEYDHSLPYGPILDLLRERFSRCTSPELHAYLGSTAPEIVKLLPELANLLQDIEPSPALEPEQEKRRLFSTLVQLFDQLIGNQPTLIVLEDLHWSDDTTLEFLLRLTYQIAHSSFLLLLTFRTGEQAAPLSLFLAELNRRRVAMGWVLSPLTPTETGEMVQAIFDFRRPAQPEFLNAIHQLTEGNPFFIEEVLKDLVASEGIHYEGGIWIDKPVEELQIPGSILDAVQRRFQLLDAPARSLLSMAAVAGRRFDFSLLQQLTSLNEEELLRELRELIAAQLVVEESEERFVFRHDLTRRAVYSQLLVRERRTLHRRVAKIMEEGPQEGDSRLEELAYHSFQAADWEKALNYCQLAGEKALSLFSPGTALTHFNRAMEAARQLAVSPTADLLRGHSKACEILGDFEKALAGYQTVLRLASASADSDTEWQSLLDLGLLWASRDYSKTGYYFQKGLELARNSENPSSIAHSLNRIGNWHTNMDESSEAIRHHREALIIFEQLDNRRGLAETLDLMGMANFMGGDLVEGTLRYRKASALFRELGDSKGLASTLATLTLRGGTYQTNVMFAADDLPNAARDGESALSISRDIGWRSGEAYALWQLGFCLGAQGEYGRALEAAQSALGIAEEIGHLQWIAASHCVQGAIYLDLLAPELALPPLEAALAASRETGSWIWIRQAAGFLSLAYVQSQDLVQAKATLDEVLHPHSAMETMGQRLCWLGRAEVALAEGTPHQALGIAQALISSAPNISESKVIPRLWSVRARALRLLDRSAEAEADLLIALETARKQQALPLMWRILVDLGHLHRAQRRYDDAAKETDAATTLLEGLSNKLPEYVLREQFLRQATSMLPKTLPLSPRRAGKQRFQGLTLREQEVAALISQGKSNRAIAEELVLGGRTVETHVGSILSKLDFSSRAQVAAWAVQSGLTRSMARSAGSKHDIDSP